MGSGFIDYMDITRTINSSVKQKRLAVTSSASVELIHTASTVASSIKRGQIILQVSTAAPVYVGFTTGVSSTNGLPISSLDGLVQFDLNPSDYVPIYVKSTAATVVNIIETWAPSKQYP